MNPEKIFSAKDTNVINLQHQDVISIAQIHHTPFNTLYHLTLHAAHSAGAITVEEVSEEGNVNKLLLTNFSDRYIFIMDGDILKGAKQNRVVNTSILVAPKDKKIIPVSCVEQGRWSRGDRDFKPSEEVAYREIRKLKNIDIYRNSARLGSKHNVDQSGVWDLVQNSLDDLGEHSATASHSDAFESKRMDFDKMTADFSRDEKANGLAYFINGRLCGIEIFNREDVYADYFGRMLQSIAMDAEIVMRRSHVPTSATLKDEEVHAIVHEAISDFANHQDHVDVCKGLCAGEEHRLVTGKEVYYDLSCDGETVHQSIMAHDKDDSPYRRRRTYQAW